MRSNIFSVADRVRTEVRVALLESSVSRFRGDHQRLLSRQLFTWELELPMLMPASPCLARGNGGPCEKEKGRPL